MSGRGAVSDAGYAGLCAIPDCKRREIGHTAAQLTAMERRQARIAHSRVWKGMRACIGCHSGVTRAGDGTDYCRACYLRDQPAQPIARASGEGDRS